MQAYVDAWIDSGHDLEAFNGKHAKMSRLVRREIDEFARLQTSGKVKAEHRNAGMKGDRGAAVLLGALMASGWRIWRCARCRQYFARWTEHKGVYCSRECGKRETATNRIYAKRPNRGARTDTASRRD